MEINLWQHGELKLLYSFPLFKISSTHITLLSNMFCSLILFRDGTLMFHARINKFILFSLIKVENF